MPSVTVHRFESDLERFGMLVPATERDNALLFDLDGRSHRATWRPFNVKIVDDTPGASLRIGDLCSLVSIPVVSERTCEVYGDVLERYGELLTIHVDRGETMFIYNVTTVVDCLDRKNTRGFWLDRERLADGRRYAFRNDAVQGAGFFRIPEQMSGPTFATSTVLKIARDSSLTAFSCPQVWPTESAQTRVI